MVLLTERAVARLDLPGSRLPLHLASVSRSLAQQHIADRINLISAQHGLSAPSRTVSLMILAIELSAKLVYMTTSHDQRSNSNSSYDNSSLGRQLRMR
ncbi:hypothetical protein SCLCIDRAFT_1146266 [Scleroderma citrinum Foug A]|uniref:Uncharacterized protein n=1 Tax=Scleroderma citrinum Foug A TaxID=1036808 RepID=A0A0C3D7C2_9AGAM|nr:hypothetical protein SCLCIDRAFT_1146266 [Scleroderma citrinum Foug A]